MTPAPELQTILQFTINKLYRHASSISVVRVNEANSSLAKQTTSTHRTLCID